MRADSQCCGHEAGAPAREREWAAQGHTVIVQLHAAGRGTGTGRDRAHADGERD